MFLMLEYLKFQILTKNLNLHKTVGDNSDNFLPRCVQGKASCLELKKSWVAYEALQRKTMQIVPMAQQRKEQGQNSNCWPLHRQSAKFCPGVDLNPSTFRLTFNANH